MNVGWQHGRYGQKGQEKYVEKWCKKLQKYSTNSTKLSKSAHFFAKSMQKFDIFVF